TWNRCAMAVRGATISRRNGSMVGNEGTQDLICLLDLLRNVSTSAKDHRAVAVADLCLAPVGDAWIVAIPPAEKIRQLLHGLLGHIAFHHGWAPVSTARRQSKPAVGRDGQMFLQVCQVQRIIVFELLELPGSINLPTGFITPGPADAILPASQSAP